MSRHTRHARRCMAVAVCAVVASACGISPDDSPRDIDQRVATPLVEPPAVVEAPPPAVTPPVPASQVAPAEPPERQVANVLSRA